ncbi:MAG: hypothetical protein H0V38_03470 [Sporichthyaceae bacterium]|nr:hypothetical protein [Sporichthyaceae bacterium]
MTRVATAAAACAVGLAAAAVAVAVLGDRDQLPVAATTVVPSTSAASPSPTASATPTPTPTPTTTTPRATATPIPVGPLTVADAEAALPKEGAEFGPTDLPVELGSVCEGATFDFAAATPVYASLQSTEDPLQYLDAVIVVYDTATRGVTAYGEIAEAIGLCPPTRTATPQPTTPDEEPVPVEVAGEVRTNVVINGLQAVQWVQLQSADGTELRTAITVVLVENALVAISMDEDSETIEADELADDSIAQAAAIVTALTAAAAS